MTSTSFRCCRVKCLQLYPHIFNREAPIHFMLVLIAIRLPGRHFYLQRILIRDSMIKTLPTKNAEHISAILS